MPEAYQITLGLLGEELAEKVGPRGQFWVMGMPDSLMTIQTVDLRVAVQNIGIARWLQLGPGAVSVGYRWLDQYGTTVLQSPRIPLDKTVPAGSVAEFEISLTTPSSGGSHILQWDIWQQGRGWAAVRDASAATRQAYIIQEPKPTPTPTPMPTPTPVATPTPTPSVTSGADGMTIRVGVFSTTSQSMRISGDGRFSAKDEDGRTVYNFHADEIVTVTHFPSQSSYRLTVDGSNVAQVDNFVRFVARGSTILHVLDLPQYRQYRQVVEVRYSTYSERLWAINELPMEYYVKGIGEEPESFPAEGLKAATVAYRTYALSHMDPQWRGLGCLCNKSRSISAHRTSMYLLTLVPTNGTWGTTERR